MKHFITILLVLLAGWLWGQNCPLVAPFPIIPANDSVVYNFDVFDVLNNNLAAPGQGVCGVQMGFSHNSITDFEVWLISPAGTPVQLIGPNATVSPATLGGTWNVTFVKCLAVPMPQVPFQPRWNNSTNPFNATGITGTYWPYQGCLDEFNTGPVNGTWKLKLKTLSTTQIPSRLRSLNIQFCDKRGQRCCFADAGQLSGPNVAACQADSDLKLNLQPTYAGAKPDSSKYGYTYAIGRDMVLVGFDSLADLRRRTPGNYQVCGVSYLRKDTSLFPVANNVLRLDTLRSRLRTDVTLFCGEMTSNCINVTIAPRADSTVLPLKVICEGDSVVVAGQVLKTSGRFPVTFNQTGRCDSLVIVNLKVEKVLKVSLSPVLCAGDSIAVGTKQYKTTGNYVDTLQTIGGCDSIISLNLTVLPPIPRRDTAVEICAGRSVVIAGQRFSTSGIFPIRLTSRQGCDSIIQLTLTIITPSSVIRAADTVLTCLRPQIVLDGTQSIPLGKVIYRWEDNQGNPIGDSTHFVVTKPSTYFLQVVTTRSLCAQRTRIIISADTLKPVVSISGLDTLDCRTPRVTLNGAGGSNLFSPVYNWTTGGTGRIEGAIDQPIAVVSGPGFYNLRVTNGRNGCFSLAVAQVNQDTTPPLVNARGGGTLTCTNNSINLDGTGSSQGVVFRYLWTGLKGQAVINPTSLQARVQRAGAYQLSVTNTINHCIRLDTITVLADTIPVSLSIDPPLELNCTTRSVTLTSRVNPGNRSLLYVWTPVSGGNIVGANNSPSILVNRVGRYALEVTDLANGCTSGAVVDVRESSNTARAVIATPALISCTLPETPLDGSGSLGGNSLVFKWSTIDGRIIGANNTKRITAGGRGTYQLLVRDTLTQCKDSSTVAVQTDNSFPIADAGIVVDLLTCQNPRLRLNGLNSSGGAAFEYEWSGACIIGSNRQPLVTVSCAGNYKLTVRNKTNGCVSVDSVIVFSNQIKPRATVSPIQTIDCAHPILQIPATLDSAGAQFIRVKWTGPGIISPDSLLTISVNKPGQYIIKATNRQNGCVSEAPVNVLIDTLTLKADAGLGLTLDCKKPQGSLLAQGVSNGLRLKYSWSTTNGLLGQKRDSLGAVALRPGIYRFMVKDTVNGCFAIDSVVAVNSQQPPLAQAGQDQELSCSRPSVALSAQGSAIGIAIRYHWQGPCPVPDSNAASITTNCEGAYILQVLDTITGCTSTDTVSVRRNPLTPNAVAAANAVNINCTAGEAILSARGSSGGQIHWFFQRQEIGRDTQLLVRTSGDYLLVIENTNLGCSDSVNVVVAKDCKPIAKIAPAAAISCKQAIITLDGSGSTLNASIRYRWLGPGADCIVSDSLQPRIMVKCAGTYQLIVENIAVNERDTASIVITANQAQPVVQIAPADTLTCSSPTLLLDGSGSSRGVNIKYSWLNNIGIEVGNTAQIRINTPGSYTLEVLDTLNGCFAQNGVLVLQNTDFPQISFNNPLFPCNQDTFNLRANVLPIGQNYQFSWTGPGVVGRTDTLAVKLTTGGQYVFSATNLDNKCIVRDTVIVVQQLDCSPCVRAATTDTVLTCAQTQLVLPAAFCRPCLGCKVSWSSTDGNFISRRDTLTPLINRAGTYTLNVTDSSARSVTLSILVRSDQQLPILPAGFDASLTCAIQQIALPNPDSSSLNPVTWRWETTDGLLVQDTLPKRLNAGRIGTYRLVGRNVQTNCESFTLVRIGLDTLAPRAVAGADRVLDCSSQRLTLDGTGSALGPGISYRWEALDNGRILVGENSVNPVVDAQGRYVIRVEDARNNCFSNDTLKVVPDASLPSIVPIPNIVLNCRDTAVTINGSMPLTGSFSASWCALGNANDTLACFAQQNLSVNRPGLYSYELTNLNNSCRNRIFVQVQEDRLLPSIDAGPSSTLSCNALNLRLSGQNLRMNDALRFSWRGDRNQSIQEDSTLNPLIISGGWYTLTAQNRANFCSSRDSLFVATDLGRPQVSAGRDTFLNCIPLQIQLQGTFSSSTGGTLEPRWTANGGRIINGQNAANAQVDQPGTYRLTVRNTLNSCVAIDEIMVSDQSLKPEARINGPILISCTVEKVTLLGASSSNPFNRGLRYFWTPVDGGRIIGSPANDSMVTSRAGLYRLIVTDPLSGCQDSTDVNLQSDVNRPHIGIAPPATLSCSRKEVRLDASESATGVIFRYSWTGPTGLPLLDSSRTPLVGQKGFYRLMVRNTASGCIAVDSIEVNEDFARPQVRIRALDVLDCVTPNIELEAGTSLGRNLSYRWFASQTDIIGNPNNALIRVNAPGYYRVVLTDGISGCSNSDSLLVQAAARAIDSVAFVIRQPGCGSNQSGELRITSIRGGTAPYKVFLNNSFPEVNNVFLNLRPGDYTLKVQDAGGCIWTNTIALLAPVPPSVELGPDLEIKLGDSIKLAPIISRDSIVSVVWASGATISNPNNRNQVLKPSSSTAAQITIRAVNGCMASDFINIRVIRELPLFVPNIFSPNGDGVNDVLTVFAGSQVNKVKFFRIYDRWGNQVYGLQEFRPNDALLGWDGKLGNTLLNSAVFTWYAEVEMADGKVERLKGAVTLMR